MLAFKPEEIFEKYKSTELLSIEKIKNGEDASIFGAFSLCDSLSIILQIKRILGVCRAEIEIYCDDNGETKILPFQFRSTKADSDCFSLDLDMRTLCGKEDSGLFFYRYCLFCDNENVIYTNSINNYDFSLTSKRNESKQFMLTVFCENYSVPDFAKRSVMYHIFVDRFFRGNMTLPVRDDAVYVSDWYEGKIEYPQKAGVSIKNNTFFGGNLYGVCEKLDYLLSLGVNVIYLSPIFKAYSNHKYDTGDYMSVDEMFGGNEAFEKLLLEARKKNIKIILDGVFNHTGDDSRYFNRYGKYDSLGAYQSKDSNYYSWYKFRSYPDDYECWWNIKILPSLNKKSLEVQKFFLGDNGVIDKYLKIGGAGFRLDVADELPCEFLEKLRLCVKSVDENNLIIGEVWENAANKISYNERRRYLRGKQLDSVMNYPIRDAIIAFVKNADSEAIYNTAVELYSSYPKFVSDALMNILGTHDTVRIITELAGKNSMGKTNFELSQEKMTDKEMKRGVKLLKLASILQFTLFGMPSIFYGDETGLEGYGDPFCRATFKWGKENIELLEHYKTLGKIKSEEIALHDGLFKPINHENGIFAFVRKSGNEEILVLANAEKEDYIKTLDGKYMDLISQKVYDNDIKVLSETAVILKKI